MLERPGRRPTTAFWIVAAAFTTVMALGTVPSPLYVLYQARSGYSGALVTVVFAAYAVGALAGLLLLGHVSDQLGRVRMLRTAVLTAAASAIVFAVWADLPGLLIGRVLSGAAVGMVTATGTAALAELDAAGRAGSPGRRGAVVATAANLGGLALGPLLAGLLADLAPAPLHLPYALWAAALLVLAVALSRVPETVQPPAVRRPYRPQRAAVPPGMGGTFPAAAAAATVAFGLFGLFAALGSAFVQDSLGATAHVLGGLSTAATFGAAALVQALVRDPARPRALRLGTAAVPLGLAVVVAGTWWGSLPLFLAGEVVAGGGAGVLFAAAVRTVAVAAPPDRRAEALAALFLAAYAGLTVPVLGLGAATAWLPLETALTVFATLTATAAVLAGRGVLRSRRSLP